MGMWMTAIVGAMLLCAAVGSLAALRGLRSFVRSFWPH
jgi:hypothetical protein